ncbi:MAG: acyltransferase family protein [Rhizobiaceae bacterium]
MRQRLLPLDGLRGVAAVMVVVWHLTGSMVDQTEDAVQNAIFAATIFGRTGVDLFFVLSGFLIIGILVDEREARNLFSVFYVRRACRILPPYVTLIVLYWVLFAVLGTSSAFNAFPNWWTNLGAQLSFTYNWLMADYDNAIARGFSITWSVAIEEWFYLVFPALIFVTPRRHLWKLLAGVGVLSAAGRAAVHLLHPDMGLAPYILTPLRLDGLCAGGLVAIAVRDQRISASLERHSQWLRRLALIPVLTVPILIALIRHDLASQMYLWGHLYLSCAFAMLIASIATSPARYPLLTKRLPALSGRYSYSLYLFHPLFLSLFFVLADRPERIESWGDAALTLGSLAVTIVFCVWLYRMVERRSIDYGHRFQYETSEAEPSDVSRQSVDYAAGGRT